MNHVIGIRVPIRWEEVGLPPNPSFGGVTFARGNPAWHWSEQAPNLPIATTEIEAGVDVPGWGVDHAVLTTANLDLTVDRLTEVGADLRRRTEVRCTPTGFLLAGVMLEVIESAPMDVHLYGTALETVEPLEDVSARWREAGWDAGVPHDAVQEGRRIFSVPSKHLAVMTPR